MGKEKEYGKELSLVGDPISKTTLSIRAPFVDSFINLDFSSIVEEAIISFGNYYNSIFHKNIVKWKSKKRNLKQTRNVVFSSDASNLSEIEFVHDIVDIISSIVDAS